MGNIGNEKQNSPKSNARHQLIQKGKINFDSQELAKKKIIWP